MAAVKDFKTVSKRRMLEPMVVDRHGSRPKSNVVRCLPRCRQRSAVGEGQGRPGSVEDSFGRRGPIDIQVNQVKNSPL